jgi:hypothetical protein
MVPSDNGAESVFVAGYQNITDEEFVRHYRHELDEAIDNGSWFLLSDEIGTCLKAVEYLLSKNVSAGTISVYTNNHDTQNAIHLPVNASPVHTVAGGDTERYAMMVEKSDRNITWLRPGDSLKDHGCISAGDVMDMRFTGAKEAVRAVWSERMYSAMAYYDTNV